MLLCERRRDDGEHAHKVVCPRLLRNDFHELTQRHLSSDPEQSPPLQPHGTQHQASSFRIHPSYLSSRFPRPTPRLHTQPLNPLLYI